MSQRAAEEGKKRIFKYKERNIDDDVGRVFETPALGVPGKYKYIMLVLLITILLTNLAPHTLILQVAFLPILEATSP